MKAIILANGPSSKAYKKQEGHYVIGINDGWAIHGAKLDAIAIVDSERRLKDKRPNTFGTPKHIPIYAGGNATKIRLENLKPFDTADMRLANTPFSIGDKTFPKGNSKHGKPYLSTGTLTPHFACAVALSLGFMDIEIWGVDLNDGQYNEQQKAVAIGLFKNIANVVADMGGYFIWCKGSPLYSSFYGSKEEERAFETDSGPVKCRKAGNDWIDENGLITNVVPAGVGDALWCAMVMDATKKHHVIISRANPKRADGFWGLIPFVEKVSYSDKLLFKDCTLQVNSHLEAGRRIEKFNGTVNRAIQFDIEKYHDKADELKDFDVDAFLLGIYETSQTHGWRREAWNLEGWWKIIKAVEKVAEGNGIKLQVCIFGAKYDNFIHANWGKNTLDFRGVEWGVTLHLLKCMDAFISFPSGVPILAEYLNIDTIMPFPRHLDNMHNTFCDPKKVGTMQWKGGRFGRAEDWAKWIEKNNWPYGF